jgi:putative tricarboxylic transport membrane protein
MFFATPLAEFALKFGPPEYFGVIFLGMTLLMYLSRGSLLKGVMMAVFGLIISFVGLDPIEGSSRMTFNLLQLWDGISIVPLAMGLFGIAEILISIEESAAPELLKTKIENIFPNLSDWMQSKWAILRGSVLGFFLGILPGGGAIISSFVSYGLEKRISKEPEKFGRGAIEGVAGPESANNSATAGAFVPLFTLGIPSNVVMALLFGALTIHGMRPGPFLMANHPDLFWGVVSSMYIGNVMLLILNVPLIPLWVQVLKIPYKILFPLILLFCIIGAYSVRSSIFDIHLTIIFGMVGYLFRKFDYEAAPLVLAFVLGPLFESNLRQSLTLSKGSFSIFFTRPISAVSIILAIILLVIGFMPYLTKTRQKFEGK